jgi:NAD(P)-dependent dehydrogenase (short-subunit alcohol dehydrogenase family)
VSRVVAVTGGMQGIGAAIADAFDALGDDVAVLDIQERAPYRCDVGDRAAVEEAVVAVESALGPIDVLVNNAGINPIGPSETFPEELWRRSMSVMLDGVFFCSQAVGSRMLERGRGSIVNIASINATEAFPQRAAYCAAKAGVKMLTEVLAVEWADRGVRVNAIAPGVVKTALVEKVIADGLVDEGLYLRRTPIGRLGRPDEIARAAVFLASDDSGFVTGTTLVVDGGWSAFGWSTDAPGG